MKKVLLSLVISVFASVPVWAGANALPQDTIGISSGTATGKINVDGSIDVTCVAGCASSIGESTTTIRGSSGNLVDVNSSGELLISVEGGTVTVVQQVGSSYTIRLAGDEGINLAKVDSQGRLLITSPPPEAPPGTTKISVTELDDVATTSDNVFVITNGSTLTINVLLAGCETDTSAGSVVKLFEDEDGTGSALTIIAACYCSSTNCSLDLNQDVIGDGSRAIRMRRERFSGGAREIFGRWEGFEK